MGLRAFVVLFALLTAFHAVVPRRAEAASATPTPTATPTLNPLPLDFATGGTAQSPLFDTTLGWALTLSATVRTDGLGVWDEATSGLTNSHTAGLWTAGGTLLGSVSVATGTSVASASSDGEWRFESISPTVLGPGSYVIGATYVTTDADLVRLSVAETTSFPLSFVEDRHCSSGCAGLTFPADVQGFTGFFGPNLRLTPADPTDEMTFSTVGGGGGSVSTGTTASSSSPVETSVTVPSGTAGGEVVITEGPITETPPSGYSFLGQQVDIVAPDGTVGNPLELLFSVYAPGIDPNDVDVFEAATLVGPCVAAGADPDPCVESRTVQAPDNVVIVVRTSAASPWNFGMGLLTPSTDHDVVIVGAGAAGLYAGYTLKNLGYDVLIVEASDRHGGRIYSDTLGDVGIERGAEELYADSGENLDFVFDDIVAEYGPDAQIPMFADQTMIEMDAGAFTCLGSSCNVDGDIDDFWDFYDDFTLHDDDPTDQLVSTYLESWGNSGGVTAAHRAYHLYEAGVAGTWGTTVEKLGLRSLSRESNTFDLSGQVFGLDPVGYLDALNELYFDSVVPSNLLLNSPVVTIDTSGIKPVAIDANGVYHYADAIIVTVSLGVLKADLIDFIPDHSAAKQNAIDTIGFGNGMKISLRFSSQFWDSNMSWLLMSGPLASCWDPNDYQTGNVDPVLTCFFMGKNSETMEALPDDAARITQALADLDVVFGGLPFADQPTQVFLEGTVQNWTAEPYILGSYSFPAPGTRPGPNGSTTEREVLAQPVGTELYFAGEATHNTAPSTVIGALRSGERAAGEVDSDAGGPPSVLAPTASFSADVTMGSAPLNVTFTDASAPAATGWAWDFGDMGTSSAQNPAYLYTTPGTYTVSLTASNASGDHTRVLPNLIVVPEPSWGTQVAVGLLFLIVVGHRRARR